MTLIIWKMDNLFSEHEMNTVHAVIQSPPLKHISHLALLILWTIFNLSSYTLEMKIAVIFIKVWVQGIMCLRIKCTEFKWFLYTANHKVFVSKDKLYFLSGIYVSYLLCLAILINWKWFIVTEFNASLTFSNFVRRQVQDWGLGHVASIQTVH